MTEAKLIVCGGRRIERPDLDRIEAPDPTETWFPLRHGQVLTTVENGLQQAGFNIQDSQLSVSNDNHRFFGTLTLDSHIVEGVSLAVGVRNSTDMTFPIGMCCGTRVMVCQNLAFCADIYVAKKHTKFGEQRFQEGIANAMHSLTQYRQIEAGRIAHYRQFAVGEKEASTVLLHAFEEGVLSTRTLPEAIEEWRHPSQADFADRNAWSLFNALTSALSSRQKNPTQFTSLTMKLYGLVDREVQYQAAV